jgi:hypothetical protein
MQTFDPSLVARQTGWTRARFSAAALVSVAAGLASRAVRTGIYILDKSAGDTLYAAMTFFLASAVAPWLSLRWRASAAVVFCFCIEAFKLTGLPQAWSGHRLARLVFGTTPSVHNLICYAVGVGLAIAVEAALMRRRGSEAVQAVDRSQ